MGTKMPGYMDSGLLPAGRNAVAVWLFLWPDRLPADQTGRPRDRETGNGAHRKLSGGSPTVAAGGDQGTHTRLDPDSPSSALPGAIGPFLQKYPQE